MLNYVFKKLREDFVEIQNILIFSMRDRTSREWHLLCINAINCTKKKNDINYQNIEQIHQTKYYCSHI